VPFDNGGTIVDVDWCSRREGGSATQLTYAAMTARSYHNGGMVNALVMDGSIRPCSPSLDITAWRAQGTRNGGEAVP
jgi:hypothetical protein